MVRGGIVYVALQELLLLLLDHLNTVATVCSRLLASPPGDGGQTWPCFRQALSDNTGGVKNDSIERK